MKRFKKVGILGGTFNPIHLGHLILAEQVRQLLHLQKVIFVPTHIPPHKKRQKLAPPRQRYSMVTLAVKGNPAFAVSDIELKRPGLSYSVETVAQFRTLFPGAQLYFIVGSDFLKEFSTWKDIPRLTKICRIVIARRPGYPFRSPSSDRKKLPRNIQAVEVHALDISSTQIRRRIQDNKTIRYLVPEEVRKYILKRRLYC